MIGINLSRFPFSTVQDGSVFCIPACILAVLKYYEPAIQISQFQLMRLMIIHGDGNLPSLGAAVAGIDPFINGVQFQYLTPANFDEWKTNVTTFLTRQIPVIFTTRISGSPHIRIVLEYDETGDNFTVFNPGLHGKIETNTDKHGLISGSRLTIESVVQNYSGSDAKEDWSQPDRCSDQLVLVRSETA